MGWARCRVGRLDVPSATTTGEKVRLARGGKERRAYGFLPRTDGHLQIIGQLAYHNLRSLVESFGVLLRSRGGYTADDVDALGESGSCDGSASRRDADREVENTGRAFMIDIDENDIWQR
jgi:hypothetical protein